MKVPYCEDTDCCDPSERRQALLYANGELPLDRDTLRWCHYCDICLRPVPKHSIHCVRN